MTDPLTNALADLAERIRSTHEAVLIAQRTSAEKALDVGVMLIEAKSVCGHGEWLPFLERTSINDRTARNFMTLARSGLELATVADLGGIRAALAFLTQWRLPAHEKAVAISTRHPVEPDADPGPLAFIWPSDDDPAEFNVLALNVEDTCHTKHPMRAMVEIDGFRPVNTIIHWLTLHYRLGIADWDLTEVDRELAAAMSSSAAVSLWRDDVEGVR